MPFGVSAGTAALIGAGISAAGSIGGSLIASGKAGQGAGQAQRNLSLVVPQLQQNYNTAVGGYQPYETAGAMSLQDQQDLLGLNGPAAASAAMAKFRTSPGYQFSMDQGLRAVDAGAAAKGLLRSGATLKAEQTFGTGLADQEFSNYYNRLYNMGNQGLTAAGGIATAGNNLAAGLEGNASSSAQLAQGAGNTQASIYGNLSAGLGSTVNGLFNNADFRNWISGSGSTFTPSPTGTYGGQSVYTAPTNTGAPASYNF